MIEGNAHQLLNQLVGIAIAWVLAIVGTLIILKLVDVTIGLRVSEEEEVQGLDLSQHGEEGYYWEASRNCVESSSCDRSVRNAEQDLQTS